MAALLTAGALAGPALARQGTGLYAPFPAPPAGARAERFVGELGVAARKGALKRGVAVRPAAAAAAGSTGAAAHRAGVGQGLPDIGAVIVLTVVMAVVVALSLWPRLQAQGRAQILAVRGARH
jgi:hypothetical protein